jgi:hypothetical protein
MPADLQALTDPEPAVDEEFLELVCADEELLRAEFDAIIAQEWASTPPPADPPTAAPRPTPPARAREPARGGWSNLRRARRPGDDAWGRQRSPPRRLAAPRERREGKSEGR